MDEPTPPTYPSTGLSINPDGMTITTQLAPGTTLIQQLNEETMNQVAGHWLQTRREIKRHLEAVRPGESEIIHGS